MVLNKEKLLVEFGRFPIINRTWAYLFGSLKLVDVELYSRLKSLEPSLIGVFLNDDGFSNTEVLNDKPTIFVAINLEVQNYIIESQLNRIRKCDNYLDEYSYFNDPSIRILVIELDEKTYIKFLEGKYSEMYSEDDLKKNLFELPHTEDVFKRTDTAKQQLCKLLNMTFETKLTVNELEEDVECELPPIYSTGSKYFETITYE